MFQCEHAKITVLFQVLMLLLSLSFFLFCTFIMIAVPVICFVHFHAHYCYGSTVPDGILRKLDNLEKLPSHEAVAALKPSNITDFFVPDSRKPL